MGILAAVGIYDPCVYLRGAIAEVKWISDGRLFFKSSDAFSVDSDCRQFGTAGVMDEQICFAAQMSLTFTLRGQ